MVLNMMFAVCFFLPGIVCSLPALIFSIQVSLLIKQYQLQLLHAFLTANISILLYMTMYIVKHKILFATRKEKKNEIIKFTVIIL